MSGYFEKVERTYRIETEIPQHDFDMFADIAFNCGRIRAIQCVRRIYPIGLKEAKDFIDSLLQTGA
jgi:ribosomal protein L7/L12